MTTTTTNKVSVLDDMAALGIAIAEGHAQRADGVLPESLDNTMKTLSERLAEGMSNEFYRIRGAQNERGEAENFKEHTKEFFEIHDRYMKFVPGYKDEFERISSVR